MIFLWFLWWSPENSGSSWRRQGAALEDLHREKSFMSNKQNARIDLKTRLARIAAYQCGQAILMADGRSVERNRAVNLFTGREFL